MSLLGVLIHDTMFFTLLVFGIITERILVRWIRQWDCSTDEQRTNMDYPGEKPPLRLVVRFGSYETAVRTVAGIILLLCIITTWLLPINGIEWIYFGVIPNLIAFLFWAIYCIRVGDLSLDIWKRCNINYLLPAGHEMVVSQTINNKKRCGAIVDPSYLPPKSGLVWRTRSAHDDDIIQKGERVTIKTHDGTTAIVFKTSEKDSIRNSPEWTEELETIYQRLLKTLDGKEETCG